MTSPFKGWLRRVVEFLKPPEVGVNCKWLQTDRFLRHTASPLPNRPQTEPWPASHIGFLEVMNAGLPWKLGTSVSN